jgi:BlaI family penicillinase repressor
VLQRLEDKGYVNRDRSLTVHLFSAKIDSCRYTRSQLESLAAKLTGGSLAPLITSLVQDKKLSPKELSRFRAVLDERQAKEDLKDKKHGNLQQ